MKGMDKKIKRAVSGTLAAVMAASAGIAKASVARPEFRSAMRPCT